MFQLVLNGADNCILYLGLHENLGDMQREPLLQMETDKIVPRHAQNKTVTVNFPSTRKWQNRFKPDIMEGLVWYTNGSTINKGCTQPAQLHPRAPHHGIPG